MFCPAVTEGHWLVEVDRVPASQTPLIGGMTCDGRYRVLAPLCDGHRALLTAAGATGRVHGATGVRWWFVPRSYPRLAAEKRPDI
jgi:hypothetical protein